MFTGMGLMKSARLAPAAILVPANFDAYRDYLRRFKAAVASIAPIIEDRGGIDEIYIDLSAHAEASERWRGASRTPLPPPDSPGSIGISPTSCSPRSAPTLTTTGLPC